MNMFVVAFGLGMTDVTNMVLRRISAGEQNPRAFDLEGDRDPESPERIESSTVGAPFSYSWLRVTPHAVRPATRHVRWFGTGGIPTLNESPKNVARTSDA